MSNPSTAKTITQVQGLAPHPPKEHDSFSFDSIHTSQGKLSSFDLLKTYELSNPYYQGVEKERNMEFEYILNQKQFMGL